jgi:hypothetical protein
VISHRCLLWGIVLVCAACAGPDDSVPSATILDSAGVRVVTYELEGVHVPTLWRADELDLEIGEVEGAAERTFSGIADLAVSDDGSILVSDAVAREVRVYDAAGSYLGAIGRAGEGPGEFAMAPTIAGSSGDTVWAFDARANRVTSFTRTGDVLEVLTLPTDEVGRTASAMRLADGTYLSLSRWVDPASRTVFHDARAELDSIVIERLDPAGALLDTIGVMADRTRARMIMDAGGGAIRTVEAPTPYSARAVVVTDGATVVLGRSDSFELEVLRTDAAADVLLRVRGVDHPATADDIRAHQEARLLEEMGDREIDPMTRRLSLDFLPERLPTLGNVIVADGGDVWVSLAAYDLSGGLDWLVFTPDGELRGRVRTPPHLQVRAVGRDYVLGFALDELDVPYVRRYRLRAPGPSTS